MNNDFSDLDDVPYSTGTIASTGTTVAPAGTITNDSLGGGGLNDFFNSLAGAFGNAATNIVNATGAAAANAINPAAAQAAKPVTPAAPAKASGINLNMILVAVLVIGGAVYLARRE